MMIGLAPNTTLIDGENSEKSGYYLYTSDCSLWAEGISRRDYGSPFLEQREKESNKVGQLDSETIEVIYEVHTIRFVINGIDCGPAFNDLPPGLILYPSIDFYYIGCCLEAVPFSTISL